MSKVVLKDNALLVTKVAVDEPLKPALRNVVIEGSKVRACDGTMFVEYPVERLDEHTNGHSVCVPAPLIQACKPKTLRIGLGGHPSVKRSVEIHVSETQTLVCGQYTILCHGGSVPFPNLDPITQEMLKHPVVFHGRFMVSTLKKLLSALPNNAALAFRFRDGDNTPIEFRAGDAHGVVMPASLDENQFDWYTEQPDEDQAMKEGV